MELDPNVPEEARRLFEQAFGFHMDGHLAEAADFYKKSLAAWPTAEAHTFLGWVYSMQQRWEDAIAECRLAIAVDPDFGNPYNDIGAYLIELDRLDEAIPWLERAKHAVRYEPRHYPSMNLSRIYLMRNDVTAAARELRKVIEIEPGDTAIHRELHRLLGILN